MVSNDVMIRFSAVAYPEFPFTSMYKLIPSIVSYHMQNMIGDEITYPFRNINEYTLEDWVWISNSIKLYNGGN